MPGQTKQRVPSLDGLRAISILMVIGAHLMPGFGDSKSFGPIGVRVFFVISGLLITSLLVKERDQSGSISLRNFYARRSLRIFPLAYFYILILFGAWRLGLITQNKTDFVYAATYAMSYRQPLSGSLAHLWSLSVEEQFYLIWPAMFAFLTQRSAGRLSLAVIALSPVVRFAWWFLLPGERLAIGYAFPTVLDCLACGCAVAIFWQVIERWVRKIPSLLVLGAPILAWLLTIAPLHMGPGVLRSVVRFGNESAVALLLTTFVVGSVSSASIGKVLNSRPLVSIGVLSYSLYIWQQLFATESSRSLEDFAVRLIAIFACATAAHYIVEKPFLKLKERFSTKAAAAAA